MFRVLSALLALLASCSAFAAAPYTVKPGDMLRISVWGEETLDQDTLVLPDGSVSFPLAGNLVASEHTAAEVETLLEERLREFLPAPTVSVVVKATEGNRFYVLGNVKTPGTFMISSPITVVQALSLAGGLDTFADVSEISIVRQTPDGQQRLEVRYNAILSGKSFSTNYELQAGDTLLVP
ncbi:hypothetical protein E4634_07370 [Mangrovimicrobium sediminis]|uniref:Uncharacterized protein n=1 Tax=Mangrovimicrobium sediminis TaxID=2562682 RepID=A0A4Z0M3C8_9GAMM|nr:polysaccharide biosynthesis/export family protein [Haliea sp. SAOS-164]TGD73954.1 hypothetical protein E4634_07370 [Haliea sp. SAOS-164]